jgi:hypothetical protein
MLRQLLLGAIVSLGNIAIHAVAVTIVVDAARLLASWDQRHTRLWLVAIMIAAVGTLLVTHVAEVITWSFAYWLLGVAPPGADLLDLAFVNYTTLGYGDVVPVQHWRLLGPITAMNGILLFGWSTAIIFEILRTAMHMRKLS